MTSVALPQAAASRILAVEATKQFRRPRTAGVVAAAVVAEIGVCVLLSTTGHGAAERLGDWQSVAPRSTGFAVPLVALNAMNLLAFPVIAAIYAGESLAGEAGFGSLRYLASRPIARWRILAAKAAVAALLTAATITVAYAAALSFGLAAFGWHPLSVIDLQHSSAFGLASATYTPAGALLRSIGVLGLVLIATMSVFAFTILLSALTDQPATAVAGGIGWVFASRALDNIPGLHGLSPWLPVTDASTTAWTSLFTQPVPTGSITHLVLVQGAYVVGLGLAAAIRFTRADILR